MTDNSPNNFLELEEKIVEALRTVYDPEIPVNVYDLGLIYDTDINHDTGVVDITMTLTAPNCPMADFIFEDLKMKVEAINGVKAVNIHVTFNPEWHKDMMTDEAKLELGFL